MAAETLEVFKEASLLYARSASRVFRRPWRWQEIFLQTVQIGWGSLPIISVSTAFAGLVVTLEIAWHMREALSNISMVPGFTGQFILRELAIAIPALLVVSKVGASITAEIGSMKITEQLDALKLLGIDPISYLVFPRWIASILSLACLTAISIAITLFCAMIVATFQLNFSAVEYIGNLRHFIDAKDLMCALTKSMVFGSVIPIISCVYGFRCKGGAEGVGSATTQSVVASTIAVITLDFILTYFFTRLL